MAGVAQLVRATVCGTVGRGFKPHHSPQGIINSRASGCLCFDRVRELSQSRVISLLEISRLLLLKARRRGQVAG